MTNAFEYGDALLPENEGATTMTEALSNELYNELSSGTPRSGAIGTNQPYLNLAT